MDLVHKSYATANNVFRKSLNNFRLESKSANENRTDSDSKMLTYEEFSFKQFKHQLWQCFVDVKTIDVKLPVFSSVSERFNACFPSSRSTKDLLKLDKCDECWEDGLDDFGYLPSLPSLGKSDAEIISYLPGDNGSITYIQEHYQENQLIAIRVRSDSWSSCDTAEDDVSFWESEFFSYLDTMNINRHEFMVCLDELVLPFCNHPRVQALADALFTAEGLPLDEGEELLGCMVGKYWEWNPSEVLDDFEAAVERRMKFYKALDARLALTELTYEQYDELEMQIFLFVQCTLPPRTVAGLTTALEEGLLTLNIELDTIRTLFGSLQLLVQVGPYETLLSAHSDNIDTTDEFAPLIEDTKYPKVGEEICTSHWGKIFRLQDFNSNLVLKVVSLMKWERKKNGLDRWNDDVAVEIAAHRYLSSLNIPNIVEFVAVTKDVQNLYYYQEAGVELFNMVQQHRGRYWNQWNKTLKFKPMEYHLTHASPWETRAKTIFRGIFEGVQALHNMGITHRDIKLENLVCVGEGGELVGKLIDFGVTLRYGEWEKDDFQARGQVGTYPFFSPEMAFNGRQTEAGGRRIRLSNYDHYDDSKNDIWTLGLAVWCFCTGVHLWEHISNRDARFSVATSGRFDFVKTRSKYIGIRYLARRFGKERNEMMTNDLVDFLENILQPEDERLTVAECLDHPWLLEQTQV